MRNIPLMVIAVLLIGIMPGCRKDLPKPETKPKIIPTVQSSFQYEDHLAVYVQNSQEIPSLFVQHRINGKNVFVECMVSGITFRETGNSHEKKGKMVVWIDGKRNQEVTSAAFIIKGLSPGKHRLMLEMVNLDNQPFGLTKEFVVNIPN